MIVLIRGEDFYTQYGGFAILSAIFAALILILAKVAVDEVNSNPATLIRTVVVVIMVFLTYAQPSLSDISRKSLFKLSKAGLVYLNAGKTGVVNWLSQSRMKQGKNFICEEIYHFSIRLVR